MTIIGFVRHGSTDWNHERRAQGQTDIPLNGEGRQQAMALARRFLNEQWDIIATSDLSRARETAEIIAQQMGISVHVHDKRLREKHCGQIEGTTEEERILKWGENWHELELGIEENEQLMHRGAGFVEEVANDHPEKKILIVSHGALIGQTLKRLLPTVSTEGHLKNTSVTILRKSGQQWECRLYNCTEHLEQVERE